MKLSVTISTLFCVFLYTSLTAQWQTTNGIKGGQIDGFCELGDTVVALVPSGVVYSLDKGAHWSHYQLPAAFKNNYWTKVKVQNHDLVLTNFSEDIILVSRDAGQTWEKIPLPPGTSNGVRELFIQGNKLGCSASGGAAGLYHSDDWGITWTKVSNSIIRHIHVHNDTLLAVLGNKVVRSTDMGLTLSDELFNIENLKDIVGVGSSVVLLTNAQNQQSILHFTSDMGENWSTASTWSIGRQVYRDAGTFYMTDGQGLVYRSTDLGNVWETIVLPDQDKITSIYAKDSTVLLSKYNGGYWQSQDKATTWSGPYHNLELNLAQKFGQIGDKLVTVIPNDIFYWNGDSSTWNPLNLPYAIGGIDNTYLDIVQMDSNLVMLFDFQPYVSQDQGATWQLCDVTLYAGLSHSRRLVKTPNRIFAPEDGIHHGMLISDDDGVTFQFYILSGMGYLSDFNYVDGKLVGFFNRDFYTSSDEGVTWDTIPINPANVPTNFWSSKMHVAGNNIFIFGDYYMNTYKNGLIFSKDYGQTWEYRELATHPIGFDEMYALVSVGDDLVAATNKGVFRSKDAGDTWEDWSEGLPFPLIKNLIVHDGYLYCSTLRGVFRRPVEELNVVGTDWVNPAKNQTLRFLPNPASSGFYVEHPGQQGVLHIFDSNGRLMGTMATKNDNRTFMEVSNWPNGHYQIVLETADGRLLVGGLVKR